MRVLIISSNALPASPSGPAYVAGAVREAGHEVDVYDSLFAVDLAGELGAKLDGFRPDVVGLSIRLVQGDILDATAPWGTRHIDLRPRVREIVGLVRQHTSARIVLGGPGFTYYARHWLDYLDLEEGIRGEGEEAFPLYLHRLATGGDLHSVPGYVFRREGAFYDRPPCRVPDLNLTALPAYDLFDLDRYAEQRVTPGIFTKRGCAFACIYCPYGKLEGRQYRLKTPDRVLSEMRHVRQHTTARRVTFCDNNLNVPRSHAEALCRALAAAQLDLQWSSGDLRPAGVTGDFGRLLEDSGCFYVNLAIESASAEMLRRMKRGYTVSQVRAALEALGRSNVPFGASIMLGLPGETPGTIAETLAVLDDYDIPLGVWFTLGIYWWTDYQDIVAEARQAGQIEDEGQLFRGTVYLSPDLSPAYLEELVARLRAKRGYQVQVNRSS